MKVLIVKTLAQMASPGENNPRPAVVWLRLPALLVLFGRKTVALTLTLDAVLEAAKGPRQRSTRRWSYLRPEWDEGEGEAQEELLRLNAMQRARYERKFSSPRGHRCGKK
jgi:hypothetical protein